MLVAASAIVAQTLLQSCSKDDIDTTPVAPQLTGTFTDSRDGHEYTYVRYAGLDWMAENAAYVIDDPILCTIYQDADTYYEATAGNLSTRNLDKYGCLYSLEGALQAAPEGWRIMATSGWRFKGSQAFFWTSTHDDAKAGDYYFYRKFTYNNDAIYRQSMEPAANKLSVRYVR